MIKIGTKIQMTFKLILDWLKYIFTAEDCSGYLAEHKFPKLRKPIGTM